MNIGTVHGGENPNVVPDRCTARIDRRLLPDEPVEAAVAEMEAVLAGAGEPAGSYAVRRVVGTDGFSAPLDGPMSRRWRRPSRNIRAGRRRCSTRWP